MLRTRTSTRRLEPGFRFLDLTAELRTEIYSLLLGGLIIHVGGPGRYLRDRATKCTCCDAALSDLECYSKEREIREENWFTNRHLKCRDSATERLNFDILLTCKQIYNEAAPLVFQKNTFTFFRPSLLSSWLLRLSVEQTQTVRSIMIYQTNNDRFWAEELATSLTAPLIGLRKLTIFVEICPADTHQPFGKLLDPETQDVLLKGLTVFKLPHLRRVEMAIVRNIIDVELPGIPSVKELDVWAERTRKMLLSARLDQDMDFISSSAAAREDNAIVC